MAKKKNKILSLMLIFTVVCSMCFTMSSTVYAGDQLEPNDLTLNVDGKEEVYVKAFNASYAFNTYVVRDVANALKGTKKAFNYVYDAESKTAKLETGKPYEPVGNENQPGEGKVENVSLKSNSKELNGNKVKYFTYQLENSNDTYMKLVDLSMILDVNIEYADKETLSLDTNKAFKIDINQLDQDGYFSYLHGAIVSNANTGEMIYGSNENQPAAIASTTKLMTYLLVMEAIDAGKISMDDTVVLSKAVEIESKSEDGVIPMTEGQQVSLTDLLYGMLLPSSNEAALALAEHVAGSKEAFVELMNAKAAELGMTTAIFYNSHGLPDFTQSGITSKRQNKMSAKDLCKMAQYIVTKYPQVKDITAQKHVKLETLNFETDNTNTVLYNMEGVIGLKTGSTNRAGSCLICAIPVEVNGEMQTIVSVVLGAENSAERGEKSEILLRYAQQYYAENGQDNSGSGENVTPPDNSGNVTPPTGNGAENSNNAGTIENNKNTGKPNAKAPKTGDMGGIDTYVYVLLSVVAVMGYYSTKKYRSKIK